MSKVKTKSVSTRVPEDLKIDFMEMMERDQKSFSKWLRKKMEDELSNSQVKKSIVIESDLIRLINLEFHTSPVFNNMELIECEHSGIRTLSLEFNHPEIDEDASLDQVLQCLTDEVIRIMNN